MMSRKLTFETELLANLQELWLFACSEVRIALATCITTKVLDTWPVSRLRLEGPDRAWKGCKRTG